MRRITIGCTGAAVVSFFAMENPSPPPGDPYRYPIEIMIMKTEDQQTALRTNRYGLSSIETLVVITIIGIIIAILVPAVQSARESARRTRCQNNLKQVALAAHAFHNANGCLPTPYGGTGRTFPIDQGDQFQMLSWRAGLLPFLEQTQLHDSLDWNALATDVVNRSAAATVVQSYVCPSGASPSDVTGRSWPHPSTGDVFDVVRSDYDAFAGMWVVRSTPPVGTRDGDVRYLRWGPWGRAVFDDGTVDGNMAEYYEGKFRDIVDGMSNTILLAERGGRPFHMVNGRPTKSPFRENTDYKDQNGWSASNSFAARIHYRNVGVNEDNEYGIYSDHLDGAYVAMADGSVSFLSKSTDLATLAKMIGKLDGEL